jgi:hypothetical protein
MPRVASILLIASFLAPHPAAARPVAECVKPALDAVLRELAPIEGDESTRQAIMRQLKINIRQTGEAFLPKPSGPFVELMLFPVAGPYAFFKEGKLALSEGGARSLRKVPSRFIRKKGGIVPGAVILVYVQGRLQIEQVDFDEETREFGDQLGKKPYVLVDMIEQDNFIADVPEHDFKKSLEKYPKTHFLQVRNFEELKRELAKIEEREGPIYGLEIFTHGLPGALYHDTENLAPELSAMAEDGRKFALAEGAKVKVNSCLTGLGDKGEAFVKDLGSVFLPKGGTVYSARVSIMSNKVEMLREAESMSEWLHRKVFKAFDSTNEFQALLGLGQQIGLAVESGGGEIGIVNRVRTTEFPARF